MSKEQSENLDKILNRLVKADSVVSIDDFQDKNGNYFGYKENEKGENYFKDLLSVFDEFNIASINLSYLQLTPNGSEHIKFKKKGGFKEHYAMLENEYKNAEYENKKEAERQEMKYEIDRLTIKNLELQNKDLKRKLWFGIIGFILGAILTNLKDILILLNMLSQE